MILHSNNQIQLISKTSLSDVCLHVENVKRSDKADLFPEYNCLVLSPANFWQQSVHNFNQDNNLLNTIYHNHVSLKKTSCIH